MCWQRQPREKRHNLNRYFSSIVTFWPVLASKPHRTKAPRQRTKEKGYNHLGQYGFNIRAILLSTHHRCTNNRIWHRLPIDDFTRWNRPVLPDSLIFTLVSVNPEQAQWSTFLSSMAMITVVTNPILYAFLNPEFKELVVNSVHCIFLPVVQRQPTTQLSAM